MKIKAAVVEEKGGPFVIKDNIELAPLHPDDVQVHMVAS
ncbi:NAD(P)-dependent alcohol dehydrogenase, partial [Latilactobacillus sakei]|nr:NAD(P)-dependent alcohol dehydrogenase [Latilactobacillus sakei]